MSNTQLRRSFTEVGRSLLLVYCMTPLGVLRGDETTEKPSHVVDARTLHHKVLCGYQGWFRCPGDGTGDGWLHWSRRSDQISPETITVEMWPDMSEYSDQEKYLAPGFAEPDKLPQFLFSSANPRTVERHFQWIKEYGIDGVFVQRFLVELGRPSFDTVLSHIRQSAGETGRTFAICYDMSGARDDDLYETLVRDWKRLVDESKITQDDRYLHHNGKPVLMVWGFFSDRFDAAVAHRIIDFLKSDERYGVTLVGGCQWYWRSEKDAEWSRAFRRFDVLSPWNVGNHAIADGHKVASTSYWKDDLAEARRHGFRYMPVLYPGFAWTNLKRNLADENRAEDTIPRRQGEFFWRQFVEAADLEVEMAYVAMFDEVDEATAIFKVSNSPPTQRLFQTYEGLPSDFYLKLTGEGSRVIRREVKPRPHVPIQR